MTVSVNFARRPFRDTRPIVLTIGIALVLGVLLLTLNVRDYYAFRRSSAGTLAEIARLNESATQTEQLAARERSGLASVRLAELQTESTMLNICSGREFPGRSSSPIEHALRRTSTAASPLDQPTATPPWRSISSGRVRIRSSRPFRRSRETRISSRRFLPPRAIRRRAPRKDSSST
jgi:hypothetical protein